MYFRSGFQGQDEPYRIPENYSGNAFPEASDEPEPPMVIPSHDEAPLPDSPPDSPPEEASDSEETLPPKESRPHAVHTFLSSLLPPKPRGLHGGLLGNVGTEELLILGLLLLLSQNDSDDDVVLLLLLLLFYK